MIGRSFGHGNFDMEMRVLKNKLHDAKVSRNYMQSSIAQKRQEIDRLDQQTYHLQQEYSKENLRRSQAENKFAENQIKSSNLAGEIQFLQDQLNTLYSEMQKLREIAEEPGPTPLWGNYCKNGHLNCPNLPSVVHRLGNEAEIKAHEEKVKAAWEALARKNAESSQLELQLKQKSDEKSWADIEMFNAQNESSMCEANLKTIENSLQDNQWRREAEEKDLQNMEADLTFKENQVQNIEDQLEKLLERQARRQLTPAELAEIAREELAREQARQSTQPANTISQADLERIAREEVAQEQRRQAGNSISQTDLERIAREELANEGGNSSASYPFWNRRSSSSPSDNTAPNLEGALNDVADQSKIMAGNALRRMGEVAAGISKIPTTIRQNYQDLISFGHRVGHLTDELGSELDKVTQP